MQSIGMRPGHHEEPVRKLWKPMYFLQGVRRVGILIDCIFPYSIEKASKPYKTILFASLIDCIPPLPPPWSRPTARRINGGAPGNVTKPKENHGLGMGQGNPYFAF